MGSRFCDSSDDEEYEVTKLSTNASGELRPAAIVVRTQKPHTNDDRVRLALLRHRHSGVLKMVQMSEQQHTGADDADPDAVVLHLAGVRARQHVNPLHRATIEGTGIEMRPLPNIAPASNREETRFPVAPSNRSSPAVERRQARQAARQARQGDVHRIDIAARREEGDDDVY